MRLPLQQVLGVHVVAGAKIEIVHEVLSFLLLGVKGVAELLDLLLVLHKLLGDVIGEQLGEGLTLVCISVEQLIILDLQVRGVLLEGFQLGVLKL